MGARRASAVKHQHLVTEREEFSLKRRPGAEPRDDRKEEEAEERSHPAILFEPARIGILSNLG